MVTVRLLDIVQHCATNEDGQVVFDHIFPLLSQGKQVRVSFKGVGGVPSSFVNTAFVQLLEHFRFDYIKANLFFADTVKATNDLIRRRFRFETGGRERKVA